MHPLSAVAFLSASAWSVLSNWRGDFWREPERSFGGGHHVARLPGDEEAGIRVHAVVPARNEADVVGTTIPALVGQVFLGSLAVTLVDDHSDDDTAQVARDAISLTPQAHRLKIISAKPLEAGWTGKLWALECGVRDAVRSGAAPDFWLFTDADIAHEPQNVAQLVSWARAERLQLASLMVQLHCDRKNAWEKLLIPAFVYFFMLMYPFGWARDGRRQTAAAAGGCVLIGDEALRAIGGITAIRNRIIDDCSLAAALKHSGARIDLRLTSQARSLRPYGGLPPVWAMVKRSAFTQLNESWPAVLVTLSGLWLLFAVPAASIAWGLRRKKYGTLALGALGFGLMLRTFAPTVRAYGLGQAHALALPVAAALYGAMTLDSAIAHSRGRGGRWKGRTYSSADRSPAVR